MARSIISIIIILLFPVSLFGQEDMSENSSLKEGVWAMQFQIEGFFNLKAFQGTTISVKKHITDKSALRFGIGLSLNISTEDYNTTLYQNDYASDYQSRDIHENRLNVSSQYLYYLLGETGVNLFFGVGPLLDYSWYKSEYNRDTLMESRKSNSTGFGVIGIVGVEWFAVRSISFHAEYSTSANYNWYESTNLRESFNPSKTDESKSKRKYFNLSPQPVRFGISLYF